MEQPLMLQSYCVDCPFYDGFGQCTQYGNITEEVISKCEFNKNKVVKANKAPEKIYIHKSQYWGLMANEHNITKDGIEYIRKDAFIEKARKWFEKQNEWRDLNGTKHCDMESFEDFKNYMKGE